MKKLMIAAVIVCAAALSQAASVGWTNMGLSGYNGDKYLMFVVGQKGATDISTITALLNQGKSVDTYSLGGGTVANGFANVMAGPTSPQIDAQGTYTAFMVLFDSAAPKAGESKYAVLENGLNGTGYTQTIGASTASITFAGGNAASMITGWNSYGAAPEPTTGLLLLLGVAGLALKRKQA